MAAAAPLALILSGGVSLGAYQAGAWEALEAAGEAPAWICGASIGAVTAAIILGNPPERRLERLRAFWEMAAQPEAAAASFGWPLAPFAPNPAQSDWRRWVSAGGILSARLAGRPGLYHPRLPGLFSLIPGMPRDGALYDSTPMGRTIAELVDFDRLNGGAVRFTLACTDVTTGETVLFDTTRDRIGAEHLLASSAFLPDFPPVEIGGRVLVDGGLSANAPVVPVTEQLEGAWRVLLVDLFEPGDGVPSTLPRAQERQTELLFTAQTRRALAHAARDASLRARIDPGLSLDLVRVACRSPDGEVMSKAFDFTADRLRRRWELGRSGAAAALRLLAEDGAGPGMRLREVRTDASA
ncbi:MAG TPA: patatin-like phospholipase family protein [Azospirillaceae bacterium]|nr:patatin-like phospholipase family protein [Azospirillaceae bacterium]